MARSYTTFMDCPMAREVDLAALDMVIQGVPFDLATTGNAGARHGPEGIRRASKAFLWETFRWPWSFALADRLAFADAGDLDFPPGHMPTMIAALEAQSVRFLTAGLRVMTFGGDHLVTLPVLRAMRARHGPVALLHIDAHTDTDVAQHYHHGTMFHHAMVEGLVDARRSVQIGVRTFYRPASHPFTVIDAHAANDLGPRAVGERARAIVGDGPVYVTIDIDGLDPAFAPGTGTPVAGGLATNFVQKVIAAMAGHDIVGMDVVEVAPSLDPSGITALAGATLALDLLHVVAASRTERS